MKFRMVMTIGVLVFGVLVGAVVACMMQEGQPAGVQAGEYTLSGPYTHENLTIFLIHGKDALKGKNFLTLQEALEQKKVVVHETGSVNQLSIENTSQDEEVYVQSGDIVKGGQQDRVLTFDFVVPAKSGKIPIASFCVEHGRWQQRGGENVKQFAGSNYQLATKELKMAAKAPLRDAAEAAVLANGGAGGGGAIQADESRVRGAMGKAQGEVWHQVGEAQKELACNRALEIDKLDSKSSLQLSLENKKLQEQMEQYLKTLSPIIEGKKDVIGYAFAINGKVNSADVYGSSALFRKLWQKLIKASVIEAIAKMEKDKKFEAATAEAVKACLLDAEKGKAVEAKVDARTKMVTQETEKNLLFETRDGKNKDGWLHRNYMTKPEGSDKPKQINRQEEERNQRQEEQIQRHMRD